LEATPSHLDALRLQCGGQSRYFINEVSLGITSNVAARVNTLTRRNTASFLTAALRELVSFRPQWARIHLDGKPWREGHFYMVVVANGSHFGKGMRIAPMADPRDGQADVVVVEAAPKVQLLAWLPSIYLGRHVAAPFVHCARAQSIDIETGSLSGAFEGDGEIALSAPGSINLIPSAVLFSGAAHR
jgi:diacylglycerol kinase (ATP)